MILLVALLGVITPTALAFTPPVHTVSQEQRSVMTTAFAIGKNKKKVTEDLSYIETRDMTRAEMQALNQKNEEIMNMELSMMTGFSLVISFPILYLCWVAFFSD